MHYRQLGRAGVKVSTIGLGSYLTIGDAIDEQTARDTVNKAVELGINFIDTANAYKRGEAEQMLSKLLKDQRRSDLVVATKVYAPMGDGPNDSGLSAKHIFEQCDASLQRLNMDYVDLYQCHRPDGTVPVEETVQAMGDLIRRGKVLYWGVSEWPAWRIMEANAWCDRLNIPRAVSNQPRYNMLYRAPEAELFQYCRYQGIGNVVFSPLAHGVLTGKYEPGQPPPAGTRAASEQHNKVMMNLYWHDDYLKRAQELPRLAGDLNCTPAQLSLAWILRRGEVSSAIIGASKVQQVEDNAAAANVQLTDDVCQRLDELFPGPGETYGM